MSEITGHTCSEGKQRCSKKHHFINREGLGTAFFWLNCLYQDQGASGHVNVLGVPFLA